MVTSAKAKAITANMKVADIVEQYPGAAEIMAEYGLHCYSCEIGGVESLQEGVAMHGLDDDMLNALIADLNESLLSSRPQTITITPAAQAQLKAIVHQVDSATPYLTIGYSAESGLQLEFIAKPNKQHVQFAYPKAGATVCVTPEALATLGGATIDYRNDVFTFDEWSDGCCNGVGECQCSSG